MIKKIVIRDVASFDHEGCTLENLQRVNIIYGGNGTGKTTISRILNECTDKCYYPSCSIECEKGDDCNILVYNQDFKESALRETMPGVFTFGEDWILAEKKLFDLMSKVDAYKENAVNEEALHNLQNMSEELGSKLQRCNLFKPSIDVINALLKKSGFGNFRIQFSPGSEDRYQIQRPDGSFEFESLSEGEVTFISFLYFMQVAKNSSKHKTDKRTVVVIDDPISSLDNRTVDVVGSLVRELLDEARKPEKDRYIEQAIVMTHNMGFYKQVVSPRKRKDTHYWRLKKSGEKSVISAYGENNPIRGGYEFLWQELKEESEKTDSTLLPNLMRSIIETYFVVFGG